VTHVTHYVRKEKLQNPITGGFDEPDAVALFDPSHAAPYVLFVRPRDPEMEAWNGRRAGAEGAMERFGADAAYEIDDLPWEGIGFNTSLWAVRDYVRSVRPDLDVEALGVEQDDF